jgi:hypothetical protein
LTGHAKLSPDFAPQEAGAISSYTREKHDLHAKPGPIAAQLAWRARTIRNKLA